MLYLQEARPRNLQETIEFGGLAFVEAYNPLAYFPVLLDSRIELGSTEYLVVGDFYDGLKQRWPHY